jgi:plastocyanin
MLDSSFQPASLIVSAGSSVTFDLPNVGVLPHNMHIASERGVYRESPWMSETITGGKKTSLVWEVPEAPGRYRFRCDVHEAVMVGTITVQ